MVAIALDGVEATWLDDGDKRALSARVPRRGGPASARPRSPATPAREVRRQEGPVGR